MLIVCRFLYTSLLKFTPLLPGLITSMQAWNRLLLYEVGVGEMIVRNEPQVKF